MKKNKYVFSKIKKSISICKIKKGNGKFLINNLNFFNLENTFNKDLINEGINFFEKNILKKVDIIIFVRGGGNFSRILSIRNSLVKGLINFFKLTKLEKILKSKFRKYFIDDKRKKYPKVHLRKGALAKYQLSFR